MYEYKVVNANDREYWGQEWVTIGVNSVRLQQKANSWPCADRSRSKYSMLFTPRGTDWKPQTKKTCSWGRAWEEWLATARHLLKETLKKDPCLSSRMCNQEPAKQLNWETYWNHISIFLLWQSTLEICPMWNPETDSKEIHLRFQISFN